MASLSASSNVSLSAQGLHHLINIVSIKLNPANYLVWKTQILPLIESLKVAKYLHQEPPAELSTSDKGEAVPNPALEQWKEQDLLLRSWITGILPEESLYLVVGCKTSRDVWECLEENYLQATKERKVQLKRQMQHTKKGDQSLADYFKSFKTIFDGLAAIQKPVAEDDKVVYLSQGLGPKHEILVTSMVSKPPFPTYTQFVTALQSYDLRLQIWPSSLNDLMEDEVEEMEEVAVDQTLSSTQEAV